PTSTLLVLQAGFRPDGDEGREIAGDGGRESLSLHLRRWSGLLRQRIEPGAGAGGFGREGEVGGAEGSARGAGGEVLRRAEGRQLPRNRADAERDPHRDRGAGGSRAKLDLRSAAEGGAGLASGGRVGRIDDERRYGDFGEGRARARGSHSVGSCGRW